MPSSCVVPQCNSNYKKNGHNIKVCSFPTSEALRNRWIWNIKRENFSPTKYSKVCELHFKESDFITSRAVDPKTGITIEVPSRIKRFPNMLRETLLLSFLLGVAFAANSANQYVDNVLQTSLQQELRTARLIPASLPDFSVVLNPTSYRRFVTNVDFTFGNITGLERIKRKVDCSGPRNYRGEISINCTLSLFPLQSAHRTVVRNSTYSNVGKVQAAVTEVLVDLRVVGRPQNYLGLLKSFNVLSLDTLTPVFSNVPTYIRGDLPYLQSVYKRHVLDNLQYILSKSYAEAVRRAIAFKPMPRQ